jgi:hypothetical protein
VVRSRSGSRPSSSSRRSFVACLTSRVNDFGIKSYTKVGFVLHRAANATPQEKQRGPGLGDKLKDLLLVLSKRSKPSLVLVYIVSPELTKFRDPSVD